MNELKKYLMALFALTKTKVDESNFERKEAGLSMDGWLRMAVGSVFFSRVDAETYRPISERRLPSPADDCLAEVENRAVANLKRAEFVRLERFVFLGLCLIFAILVYFTNFYQIASYSVSQLSKAI